MRPSIRRSLTLSNDHRSFPVPLSPSLSVCLSLPVSLLLCASLLFQYNSVCDVLPISLLVYLCLYLSGSLSISSSPPLCPYLDLAPFSLNMSLCLNPLTLPTFLPLSLFTYLSPSLFICLCFYLSTVYPVA